VNCLTPLYLHRTAAHRPPIKSSLPSSSLPFPLSSSISPVSRISLKFRRDRQREVLYRESRTRWVLRTQPHRRANILYIWLCFEGCLFRAFNRGSSDHQALIKLQTTVLKEFDKADAARSAQNIVRNAKARCHTLAL
jgi:hypothetical protein